VHPRVYQGGREVHPRVYLRVEYTSLYASPPNLRVGYTSLYASLCISGCRIPYVCLPMYLRVWYSPVYASLPNLRVWYTPVYASPTTRFTVGLVMSLPGLPAPLSLSEQVTFSPF